MKGHRRLSWALALMAALLVVAIVVTIVLGVRALNSVPVKPGPISAANGTCRPEEVTLTTAVNGSQQSLGMEVTVGVSFPNNMSCESPDVMAELQDARGIPLVGVTGSPMIANGSHSCSTNVSAKCSEETSLYWSNWCGPTVGPYQIVATAFGDRLRSSSWIPASPPCTNHQGPSLLGGVRA